MPQEVATARSVRQAVRFLKQMDLQAPEWENVLVSSAQAVKAVIQQRMHGLIGNRLEELAAAGIADRRNGHYRRRLLTALGEIELCVPRTRTFSAIAVLERYARRQREVDRVILAGFVFGLSTRKVGEVLLPLLGERVAAATVSRVARVLEQAVAAFHERLITRRYRALIFDGVVLSRRTGAGALRRPVLVATGVTHEGAKEVIDFRLAQGESQSAWEGLLNDLYRRGLTGEELEIIVTDGGGGLLAALPLVYPRVPVQRCWAHKTRNVLDKIRVADRERAKKDLNRISHAQDKRTARREARRFADRWQDLYARAVRCLQADLDELLEFFRFDDESSRRALRTTNAIERRFREVRRRTRPMGVFTNPNSMERILFAVFTHENQKQGVGTPILLTQNS